jgi:hypothetical protein
VILVGGKWWRVELGPGRRLESIYSDFIASFLAQGSPRGAALFCDMLGRPGGQVFFTPGAAAIARHILLRHGGQPCDQPSQGFFLAGHEQERTALPQPVRQ